MVIAGYGCFYDHVGRLIVAALSVNDDVGLIGIVSFVRFYNALATGLVQQVGSVVVVGNGYAVHRLTAGDAEMARRTIAYIHHQPLGHQPQNSLTERLQEHRVSERLGYSVGSTLLRDSLSLPVVWRALLRMSQSTLRL